MRTLFRQSLAWWEMWVPFGCLVIVISGVIYLATRPGSARVALEATRVLDGKVAEVERQNRRSIEDRAELRRHQQRIEASLKRIESGPR